MDDYANSRTWMVVFDINLTSMTEVVCQACREDCVVIRKEFGGYSIRK